MSKTVWLINQYASTPETGMGGRHYYLAKGLERLGHNVFIIAASYTHLLREPPNVVADVTLEQREGVKMVWLKMPKYDHAHDKRRIWNWFYFSFKVASLRKEFSSAPDVVLYSSPGLIGFLGARWLAKKFKAMLVFDVRDIWPLTLIELAGKSPKNPFIRFLQWIENYAYHRSDKVLSNLKSADRHMLKHGLIAEKFHWIPNGFLLDEVLTSEPLSYDFLALLPDSGFLVGYTGTFGLANSMETLLGAAVLLKDHKDIYFVLVGEGREREFLETIIREHDLTNVIFTGAIPKRQVQSALKLFDALFIGAKRSDLYQFGVAPNKLYDYLYSGKPILYAIDSGDYRPVSSVSAGFDVPPEDPHALSEAILQLCQMPEDQRTEMGQRSRQVAMNEYEYSAIARSLEKIILPN